jgi:Subtilisin-like serine proteases
LSWRSGTATFAALSLAILPLSIGTANAEEPVPDTASATPTTSPSLTPAQSTAPQTDAAATEPASPAPSTATAEPSESSSEQTVGKTIIVTFDKAQSDPAEAAQAAVAKVADQVADAQVTKVAPITDSMVAVTLDAPLSASESATVEDQVGDLKGVKAAETAGRFRATTDDTYYSLLWNLAGSTSSVTSRESGSHAEDAWTTTTGANAIVGVIDTGITAHPDLTASSSRVIGGNIIDGYDFITDASIAGDGGGRDSNPTDTGDFTSSEDSSWHGTHVAGIVAALGNNGIGVAGVAPNAKVEPLRVLGRGGGDEQDVIAAIYWGAGLAVSGVPTNTQPANVLNLSLGMDGSCSTAMQTAINAATAKGVIVVAAAGNGDAYGNGLPVSTSSPANCNNVISVGATTKLGTLASYSNYGNASQLTLSAPGGGDGLASEGYILSTINAGTTTTGVPAYGYMSGTSMAAPHVAATIAMLKSLDPTLTLTQVKTLLTSTVDAAETCGLCGAGRLNTSAAVAALVADLGVSPASTSLQAAAPQITGTPRVGMRLTAQASAEATTTLSYQWYRSGSAISGATSSSYLLTSSDKDKYILVKVTASSSGQKTIRFSSETGRIASGTFTKSSSPKASGTYRSGRTLTASKGTWSPTPSTYTYRWLRNGKSISGATKSKYKLTYKDKGKKISVRVTVSKSGYTTTSATSSSHTIRR